MDTDRFDYLISKENKKNISNSLEWKAYKELKDLPGFANALISFTSEGIGVTKFVINPEKINGKKTFYTPHNTNLISEMFRKYKILNVSLYHCIK